MIPGAPMPQGGPPMGQMPAPHPMQPPAPAMPSPGAPQAPQQPPAPPAPPMVSKFDEGRFAGAINLLKDQRLRGFRCDIETESTIVADQEAQQESRMKMIQAMGAMVQSMMPMVQSMPAVLPLMGKMLLFGLRSFNAGVELEGDFEDAITKLEANPSAAMQNNPNSNAAAAKQAELQGKMQLQAQDIQQDQEKHAFDMQAKQMDLQADQVKAAAEIKRAQIEEQAEMAEHARNLEAMRTQAALGQGAPLAPQKLMFGQGPAMTGSHK